jgi:phenylpropionate dioxygenase-like ring-hydroxylating dioxygenase large terminal subunit
VAPEADQFPAYPVGWYLFGRASELARGPITRSFLGRRLVAYRGASGAAVVMDARCSHLGSDLGLGRVVGDAIECPFHAWRYGPDGRCTHIPAVADGVGTEAGIPAFACQTTYPAGERAGMVFFFATPAPRAPLFPLPFFDGIDPAELLPGPPFETVLDCPWFMVGANGFDAQHFRAAHDRRLVDGGATQVSCPAPFARRASATFAVEGDTLRDRLTRTFAGDRVTLTVTDWCGNLILVTARFRRTTSYGMVTTVPLGESRTAVRVTVFVRRGRTRPGRALFDPLNAAVRSYFIREFLRPDAERLQGVRYNPHTLIEADREMAEYFAWLARVSRGLAHENRDEG